MPFDNERLPKTTETCERCGTPKIKSSVAHPIHDGPWPKSGFGQVARETVQWCPNCDPEPHSPGQPILR